AMAWYYETAPLPSIGGWYAHQLPLWAHQVTAAVTLLGELVAPLLIWGGRRARHLAFILILRPQPPLEGTANSRYFNLLSAVVALWLLDGRDLQWLRGWLVGRRAAPDNARGVAGGLGRASPLVAVAAGGLFLLTLLELMVLLAEPGVASFPG